MDRKPVVQKLIRNDSVFFTVCWSRLKKADKYEVIKSVPSEAGIYELYWMDEYEKINLFYIGKSWYGGLRNEIRVHIDAELETDGPRRTILTEHDCWYRWTLVSDSDDMADLLYFFAGVHLPGTMTCHPSGKYVKVFVKEVDADKIVTI